MIIDKCQIKNSNYLDEMNKSKYADDMIFTKLKQGSMGNVNVKYLSVEDSSFYKCFAQRGGIFYIISEISPTIQITNCNFTNIIAVQEGGAFFFSLAANSI